MGRKKKKKIRVYNPFPRLPKGRKTEIKLFIWREDVMSLDGYKQFSPKVRPHMRRVVFRPHLRIDAPVMEISNKELLGNFIIDCIGQTGKYIVRGGSHGKTKYHFKWVRLAVVDIREVKEELRAYVSPTFRLQRYWYWTD